MQWERFRIWNIVFIREIARERFVRDQTRSMSFIRLPLCHKHIHTYYDQILSKYWSFSKSLLYLNERQIPYYI